MKIKVMIIGRDGEWQTVAITNDISEARAIRDRKCEAGWNATIQPIAEAR